MKDEINEEANSINFINDKLTASDKLELAIQAGLNAIPYLGGSLSTLYFGAKQERRFKRIEFFYETIKTEFIKISDIVLPVESHDKAKLASLIEEINEGVERDYTQEKIRHFKNCFFNILTSSNEETFGKRKYFINKLSDITEMDIDILQNLYTASKEAGYKQDLESKDEKFSEFNGSLEKLKSYGFASTILNGALRPGINWAEITVYSISDFGKEFVKFCLENESEKLKKE